MFTKYNIAEMLTIESKPERRYKDIEYLLKLTDNELSEKFAENCGAKLQRVSNNMFMIKY
jgi:hypothetical protein